jgi:hypothetical protein
MARISLGAKGDGNFRRAAQSLCVDLGDMQVDAKVFVGKDVDDAVAFQLAIGPAGEVYREAGKLAEERHSEIAAALKAQLAKYQGPNGVMMDSSSWKVTARNPV